MSPKHRKSSLQIMGQLIKLIKKLVPIMLGATILGVTGFLCAIFLTIIAGAQVLSITLDKMGAEVTLSQNGFILGIQRETVIVILISLAVLRGVLHYGEQYCNHYLAFKILATIRNKVFASLRQLCPAKLEGRDKGNLISIITTDIELLEVFYAHTLSPILIGSITSIIMIAFISSYSVIAGIWAFIGYTVVGFIIPCIHGKLGADKGMKFRTEFGGLNSMVLESLRGIDETLQYGGDQSQKQKIQEKSKKLADIQQDLNQVEVSQHSITTTVISAFSMGMFMIMLLLNQSGYVDYESVLITTIAMMGSFGPVIALSNLSNNLHQTLASGERVLSILEEQPQVLEVEEKKFPTKESNISVSDISFGYENENILNQYSIEIPQGKIVGIHGASGAGKSTLLKLLMRFWDVKSGSIIIGNENIKRINTQSLRNIESYVTQETHIFQDTIRNNITLGKSNVTQDEIIKAAKQASIHEFIIGLSHGYDTEVAELGDSLSGGEKQRIGIARAFLHDSSIMLLDEPTSNLDSLNEGIILKSLNESCKNKTVVLVSHRKSTMNIADIVFEK